MWGWAVTDRSAILVQAVKLIQQAFRDAGVEAPVTVVLTTGFIREDGGPSIEYTAAGDKVFSLSIVEMAKFGMLKDVCDGPGTDGYTVQRD